jgi:Porin PorA
VALSLTGAWGRRLTRLALAVGLLLLVAAPVMRFWVTPVLAQSPEVPGGDGFLTHVSTGTITTLFDLETAESTAIEPIPVTRTESTRGFAEGAQEAAAVGANASVTNTTDRTVTDDGRLIAQSEYRLAADRHTQALIDCCGVQVGGVTVPMAGSGSPLRLPWFTPEESYPYFDLTLLAPADMSFIGPEEVGGMTAMKFQQAASPTPIGTVQAPGVLVGSTLATVPLVRTHVVNRTIWVDPTTGIILRKVERIREALRDSAGKDILTLLAMTTSSTPEQVDAEVARAREEGRPVLWTHSYGPMLAVALGLVLLAVGLAGVIMRTRAARVEEDFPDELASFDDLREAFD